MWFVCDRRQPALAWTFQIELDEAPTVDLSVFEAQLPKGSMRAALKVNTELMTSSSCNTEALFNVLD